MAGRAQVIAIKKKNNRLMKESTAEGKARVKAELDKKVLIDQVRAGCARVHLWRVAAGRHGGLRLRERASANR